MIDAPVSGGVQAAAQGTLTFIVGGTKEGEARARPLLEAMGKSILHCGDSGAGGIAKVCSSGASFVSIFVFGERRLRLIVVVLTARCCRALLRLGSMLCSAGLQRSDDRQR